MSKSKVICTGGSYIAPVIVVSELLQRSVITSVFQVWINRLLHSSCTFQICGNNNVQGEHLKGRRKAVKKQGHSVPNCLIPFVWNRCESLDRSYHGKNNLKTKTSNFGTNPENYCPRGKRQFESGLQRVSVMSEALQSLMLHGICGCLRSLQSQLCWSILTDPDDSPLWTPVHINQWGHLIEWSSPRLCSWHRSTSCRWRTECFAPARWLLGFHVD